MTYSVSFEALARTSVTTSLNNLSCEHLRHVLNRHIAASLGRLTMEKHKFHIPLHHDQDATESIIQPYDGHLEAQTSPRSSKEAPKPSKKKNPLWQRAWMFISRSKSQTAAKMHHGDTDYLVFKDNQGKNLIESLLRCVTICPSASDEHVGVSSLLSASNSNITIDHYLEDLLRDALHPQESQYLQIW